jgi:hypothetical protein
VIEGRRAVARSAAGVLGIAAALVARDARAEVRVQLLVIGTNQAFSSAADGDGERRLAPLRYADDDAAAFYELMATVADTTQLLTVMDAETQARFPKLAAVARPPSIAELRAAIEKLEARIESNRRHGDQNLLYVFFSGHGAIGRTGPELALLDGGVTHEMLYDEILGRLHADVVHLFVDACHAEGVVRPRDSEARVVDVNPTAAEGFLVHSTLARFPQVGAIVAASTDAQAHEWDQLGHGVFTSELLSALRGAADVNGDRRIEYSEVYAFLGAANRNVQDPRARLSVVARPPEIDRHAAIVDLSRFPDDRVARLAHIPAGKHLVEVEDGTGRRLATFRGEADYFADLVVPPGTTYVRVDGQEASFESGPGGHVAFTALKFAPPRSRERGALEDALRRGLFGGEYGRGYYTGFTDQAVDFAPVSFGRADAIATTAGPPPEAPRRAFELPSEVLVGAGVSTPLARALGPSTALRLGLRPREKSGAVVLVDGAQASRDAAAERQLLASVGWLWSASRGPLRGWFDCVLGGGLAEQTVRGASTRSSGVLAAGPKLGGSIGVASDVGLWLEAEVTGLVYREENKTTVGLRPAVLMGASWRL